MPIGILLIRWDDKLGTTLVAKYSKKFKFLSRLLVNIYFQHRIQSMDPSFITITLTNTRVSRFFFEMDENYIGAFNYIIALVLRCDETPHLFREILKKATAKTLKKVDKINQETLQNVFLDMRKVSW